MNLASRRSERAREADVRLTQLYSASGARDEKMALVAVGGYGRSELSPHSDLDVVLLHGPEVDDASVAAAAEAIWYPLWNDQVDLDHAVRRTTEMRTMASEDYRAAMGMLDARCVAGDHELVRTLRSEVLSDWRRDARSRVRAVRDGRVERLVRAGWLAHSAVPDLKESGGGLRDGVVLRALVATWLIDVPHAEAERLRSDLLDVRDTLHDVAGRRLDRFEPDLVPEVAERLSMGPVELDLHTRDLGRRVAHLSMLAWRRVEGVLSPRTGTYTKTGPVVRSLGDGVGVLDGEIIVTRDANPASDPEVALRAAAAAAREHLPLSPGSAMRLNRTMGTLPDPWTESTRRLMVDLLTAGPGLVAVWDELDFAGVIDRILPEWAPIRLRGSSSIIHQFTIDRHSLETCVNAAEIAREVSRPDLLAVAALLHDLGKGVPGDHSVEGEPMARAIAARWGFSSADADVIGQLVRWHLLLPDTATRRDIEDPGTAHAVAETMGSAAQLELLAALTSSDARATSGQAWSAWRRGLVEGLVEKTYAVLDASVTTPSVADYEGWPRHIPIPAVGVMGARDIDLTVDPAGDGSLLTIVTANRPGVIAELAGGLALAGHSIRSARTVTLGDAAVSLFEVRRSGVDAAVLRERLRPALAGDIDLAGRLDVAARGGDVGAQVRHVERDAQTVTVLEVRAADRRGLLWTVCRAIAAAGHSIRSAHMSTYGEEAREVLYVLGSDGARLDDEAASRLRDQVAAALA
ncbi:MAG: [protein-PII] uridylyltransferase [Aeromicrobium sp.]|uniref:[protein-PII] uridylyltransferase n=1 Tax=Aeromicrobium sp. TaxID=1871063 RepID=UPI003C44CD15